MTPIWVESVWQDVRYAVRNLRRQPGFTLVALSILTIGIGLNTAVFTLFKEAILQPWSGIADPSRVVRVQAATPASAGWLAFPIPSIAISLNTRRPSRASRPGGTRRSVSATARTAIRALR